MKTVILSEALRTPKQHYREGGSNLLFTLQRNKPLAKKLPSQ